MVQTPHFPLRYFAASLCICLTAACSHITQTADNEAGAQAAARRAVKRLNLSDSFLIEDGHAGLVKLVADTSTLPSYAPGKAAREVSLQSPSGTRMVKEIVNAENKPLLQVEEEAPVGKDTPHLSRITVLSPDFNTREGVGVGSTLGELRRHYKVISARVTEDGLNVLVEQLKVRFILDANTLDAEQLEKPDVSRLPDGLIVQEIVLEP